MQAGSDRDGSNDISTKNSRFGRFRAAAMVAAQ
jgi:hypothetical protein